MKNSCTVIPLTDSFRQLDQNLSVDSFVLLFEVHITFGFQSEVPPLLDFKIRKKKPVNLHKTIVYQYQFLHHDQHILYLDLFEIHV